jgi:hypothetical protein
MMSNPPPYSRFPLGALVGIALAAAFALPASAQADKPQLELALEVSQLAPPGFDVSVVEGAPGGPRNDRIVKGAPYCAEAMHENVQWLPDGQGGMGNRITRKSSTKLCRDGEGRTRLEVDSGGHRQVYLSDPVAREIWALDPEKRTARQFGGRVSGSIDSQAWRDYAERMREWARAMAENLRANLPEMRINGRIVLPPPPSHAPGGAHSAPPTPPTPPAPPAMPAPPMPAPPMPAIVDGMRGGETRVYRFDGSASIAPPEVRWRAQQFAPRGAGVASSLGSKEIEGLRVNGERTTWTIEAGKVGNERPIVITRDVWTSPDLMLTVQSRDFDPRSGEVAYRLQNIRRGEPDAALMKPPPDYKVTRRVERSERRIDERHERRDERRDRS